MTTDLLDFNGKFERVLAVISSQLATIGRDKLRLAAYTAFACGPLIFAVLALALILLPDEDEIPAPTGCSQVGLKGKSNLHDEFSPTPTNLKPNTEDNNGPFRVKSLFIYPIKGCKSVELAAGDVVSTGLNYDRHFSFAQLQSDFPLPSDPEERAKSEAKGHQWRFITQREFPLMSQLTTELWLPDPTRPAYNPDLPYVQSGGAIIVSFPYDRDADGWRSALHRLTVSLHLRSPPTKSFIIPYNPTPSQIRTDYGSKIENFKIWKDTVPALNMGAAVPPELAYLLGVRNPLTLFRALPQHPRQVFRCAPRASVLGWQPVAAFADAYPLNILGLASVRQVSAMQPSGAAALSARRFRPNIVMEGAAPFAEDGWKKVQIGAFEYFVVCRCVRCKVPNVDLETGVRDRNEPYRTLVKEREIDRGAPKLGCLGMQMVPVLQEGVVCFGDEVQGLEVGEHEYIKQ